MNLDDIFAFTVVPLLTGPASHHVLGLRVRVGVLTGLGRIGDCRSRYVS